MTKTNTKELSSFLFHKNQNLQIQATDMNLDGYGVAKVDGFVVFVNGLLMGETAIVKLVKVHKNYAYAIIVELLISSPHRVVPICSVYDKCGGCDLMHGHHEYQRELKQKIVSDQFVRNEVKHDKVYDTIAMSTPYHYRNKIATPIKIQNGQVEIGFYRQHSHDIVTFEYCHVQSDIQNRIIVFVREFFSSFPIESLRHIIIRQSYAYDSIMIGLITSTFSIKHQDMLIKQLTGKFPMIKSIVLNLNDKDTNAIFGKQDKVIYGDSFILDRCLTMEFKISLRSFYQINSIMMEKLYEKALEYAHIQPHETVLDLYCGIGTIALLASQQAKKVYGVEINAKAIEDAKENAKINKVKNVEFLLGDVKEVIAFFKKNNIVIDTIIVDPPRSGLHDDVIDTINNIKVNKVVYVSCNPATLARDCKKMEDIYKVEHIQPVDMFGQTKHVETVVLMSRIRREEKWSSQHQKPR